MLPLLLYYSHVHTYLASYAPALARLRPIARIIRFRKAQPVLIANRLRDICQNEDLRADARALTALVTVAQGDMRACINTLQVSSTCLFICAHTYHPFC